MSLNSPVASSRSVLQSVQALRGLAALMVVVAHVFTNLNVMGNAGESESIFNFGVDIFFVISGFIMISSTRGKDISAGQFMLARIVRIVPLYWLALLAMLGMLAVTGGRIPVWTEIAQAAFFIPYQDPTTGAYLPFLPVGWTLNYEMVFYLAFAATIAIGGARQVLLISLLFALFVAARVVLNPDSAIGFRLTSPLFFEFSMGMMLALLWGKLRTMPWVVAVGTIIAGVVGLLILHPLHIEAGLARVIAHGIPAMLVVAGALGLESWFAGRSFSPLMWLGDASYSLYLSHVMPLMVLPHLLPEQMPVWIRVVLLTAACVVVGGVCFRLVEQPMTSGLRRWARRQTRPALRA